MTWTFATEAWKANTSAGAIPAMVAGSAGDINFSSGALSAIYRYSEGIPRLINLAADRALLAGYAEQSVEIGRSTVVKGLKSLEGEDIRSRRRRVWRRRFIGIRSRCFSWLIDFSGQISY